MKKEIQVSNEREPTEEMILAGIKAANRTMPYVSDAQCVAAIWKAMQAANSQALPQGLEEWIDSEQVQLADESPAGWGRYIPTSKARSYLSGMAIVPVYAIKLQDAVQLACEAIAALESAEAENATLRIRKALEAFEKYRESGR